MMGVKGVNDMPSPSLEVRHQDWITLFDLLEVEHELQKTNQKSKKLSEKISRHKAGMELEDVKAVEKEFSVWAANN